MKQLEKILIPTDLSEHSRRALIYGCWLASEQKASLVMLAVETTSPAAFTVEPWWKITPDWLTIAICPLAVIWPAICEGFGVTTRFSVTEVVEGCWNWTAWFRPTSKLCQVPRPITGSNSPVPGIARVIIGAAAPAALRAPCCGDDGDAGCACRGFA